MYQKKEQFKVNDFRLRYIEYRKNLFRCSRKSLVIDKYVDSIG